MCLCHSLFLQSSFRSYGAYHCQPEVFMSTATKCHKLVLMVPVKWAMVRALIIHPSWICTGLLSLMKKVGLRRWGVICWYWFISLKIITTVMRNPRRSRACQQRAGVTVSVASQTIHISSLAVWATWVFPRRTARFTGRLWLHHPRRWSVIFQLWKNPLCKF